MNEYDVSQKDMEILSAMIDGEVSDIELDQMLSRMSNEPKLGQAWTRLSQLQAASHRHAQTGFDIDLSGEIADKLARFEMEQTPTPVISIQSARDKSKISPANDSEDAVSALVKQSLTARAETVNPSTAAVKAEKKVVKLDLYDGVERRRNQASGSAASPKKKSLKQQLFAHLAVAASVASVTVWLQNSMFETQLASNEVQVQNIASGGSIPASLRQDQNLPMATVGNGTSKLEPVVATPNDGLSEGNVRVESTGGQSTTDVNSTH